MNTLSKYTHDMNTKTIPGISGYGQEGAKGFTGDAGNITHFSIYTSYADIIAKVGARISLDGLDTSVDYNKNDLIIARDGKIWTVSNEFATTITLCQDIFSSSIALDFVVNAPDADDVAHVNIVENPYYLHQYADHNSSPWMCHRDRYSPINTGCWFKFKMTTKHIDGMTYSCGITLPNGNTIQSTDFTVGTGSDDYPTCYLFVDSRYIFDTHPISDDFNSLHIDGYHNGSSTAFFNKIKYNGVSTHEYDSAIGDYVRSVIKKECMFYIVAESTVTGKIYRRERKYNGS